MKVNKSVLLLVFILLAFFESSIAQQAEVIDQVKETIKAGSATELGKYLNQTVDVMIGDKMQNYSKAQAEFVLRDFFKAHPPSRFEIVHSGASKSGQPYAIGLYHSGSETYQIFFKAKAVKNLQLVHEIHITKE